MVEENTHKCAVCRKIMEKALLFEELFDPSSGVVVKSTKSVPGDKCFSCGAEEFEDFGQSVVLDRDLLNKLPKDSPLKESLKQRIEAVIRFTGQQN